MTEISFRIMAGMHRREAAQDLLVAEQAHAQLATASAARAVHVAIRVSVERRE